nr:uncharacterized protein LOC117226211 [Megalopta genalis]
MPRSVSRPSMQSHYVIDEAELIEFVKRNPIMYETNLRDDIACSVDAMWENLADKFNAPVDAVKQRWLKIKDSNNRRKSLRAHNLDFLSAPSLDLQNDNSCPSSTCSSPKGGKRSTRSMSQHSQLSTASESGRTNSTLVSNAVTQPKQANAKSRSRMSTAIQKDELSIRERQSVESNVRRYQDISSMTDSVRPAISDSSFAPKSLIMKNNAAESMRAFFESMAMTVLTFPAHIQASLKIRICSIITDAEYDLSTKTM